MTEEAITQAVELRNDRMSFNKIGLAVGYSPNTVAKALQARGHN